MTNPLNNDVQFLKGVGSERAKLLNKLGIMTVRDVIDFYPRAYEDRTKIIKISQAQPNEVCSVIATVVNPVREARIRKGLSLYKFTAADETGRLNIVLFNQKYAAERIHENSTYLFYGKIEGGFTSKSMTSPVFEEISLEADTKGSIVPLYHLCNGLSQKIMYKITENALKYIDELEETLDTALRQRHNLCYRNYALQNIHRPQSVIALEVARRRLAFEELLLLQLGLFRLKKRNRGKTAYQFSDIDLNPFYNALPFSLTGAQKKAIGEAMNDLKRSQPMTRLIQGDVGSGKTMVAAALIYAAYKNRCQSALMAPTEILAAQHYNNLSGLLGKLDIRTVLLTGSQSAKEKEQIYKIIESGEADLIIGTHALIQDKVVYKKLGLVITDEQHRFGVKQRAVLSDKGENPHVLVMSATPIPRSLALILYGDLDISVIDEMPPGRKSIDTFLVDSSKHDRIYNFAKKNIDEGRQVYVVCPLAEENEENEDSAGMTLKDAVSFNEELNERYFKGYKTAFIHGKLKAAEKDRIMTEFKNGNISLLVSTTVIEVGVDVPNASVMIIENAERFGLSQLHQLRGRVGRGEFKSYCILVSDNQNERTKERLDVMCKTNDGFEISRRDLELRGPGDFFGERQSGTLKLKIADIMTDVNILKEAQEEAQNIIKSDPELTKDENRSLKYAVRELFYRNGLNIYQ